MSDNTNPFAAWQQMWQQANPQTLPFLPPTTLEEVEKRLLELESVEMWLQVQVQTIQLQKALLAQQKLLFETLQHPTKTP